MSTPRWLASVACVALASAVWPPSGVSAGTIEPCAGYGEVTVTGTVTIDGIDEVSGVVASRRRPILWIEEDSGNPARIYAIGGSGQQRSVVDVDHAQNLDWEDIAISGRRLWLADIGDNFELRASVRAFWFAEPGRTETTATARVLQLRYEDGAHNAEAMVVDGKRKELYIFTKEAGTTSVYRTSILGVQGGDSRLLTKIASLPLNMVTAADLGPDGVIVKSGAGYLYRWTSDRTVPAALAGTPCRAETGPGESLAFARGGGLYAIPEGSGPSVYFTRPT
jgi:hypothetical protein